VKINFQLLRSHFASLHTHRNHVWHYFQTSEKDFEPWQVWILIQQNKGMRTKVLNFPTVPVLLFVRQQNITREHTDGWMDGKISLHKVVCMRMLRERRFLFVSFFHVIFASLTYIIHWSNRIWFFPSFGFASNHLASSSHINFSMRTRGERFMGKFLRSVQKSWPCIIYGISKCCCVIRVVSR
jgi:hypothetical protein